MNVYATVFSDLNRMMQTQLFRSTCCRNSAHSNLFCLMFCRGILGRTVTAKFGRLLGPAMLSPEEVSNWRGKTSPPAGDSLLRAVHRRLRKIRKSANEPMPCAVDQLRLCRPASARDR